MLHKKKIIGLVVAAIITLFAVWAFNYAGNEDSLSNETTTLQQSEESQRASAVVSEDGKIVSYEGVEGQNALQLLKSYTTTETEEFTGIGEYVTRINGLLADSTENYWSFYVNGETAQVGAGDYVTKDGDQIEWRLEDVSTFDQ
jgi:hypothetical protein